MNNYGFQADNFFGELDIRAITERRYMHRQAGIMINIYKFKSLMMENNE